MAKAGFLSLLLATFLTGASTRAAAQGKPALEPLKYENVTLGELVGTFKAAYARAGFQFKEAPAERGPRGDTTTTLVFEYVNPDAPDKNKAVAVTVSS